ncbi:MAG: flagellar biosynthetic protein FliR [Rhodospirillales bacterium]|nr:flagellar biosynthetic protein FliR [Rhodospirillales bacterium]
MLAQLLPIEIFAVLLVFVRVGAALMLLPGIGEPFVTPRIRLLLALLLALLVTPVLAGSLPAQPASPWLLGLLVLGEAVVGIFIGTIARFFISALTTAGMLIASTSALANALVNDPSAAQQGSISGAFLTVVALLVIFALDLHHLLLRAVVESYALFVPGEALPLGDISDMIARVMAKTFLLAFQIATPFIAVALIFFLGLGMLARLMPQVQIFFIAMPLQIVFGLIVMSLVLPAIILWFVGRLEETMLPFVGGL